MPPRINRVTMPELPDLSDIKAERREKQRAREKKNKKVAEAARALLPKTRALEEQAEAKRKKTNAQRVKMDIANLKVDPVMGRSPTGQSIRVDRNTGPGHILALHNAQPNTWKKEMADAAARFGRDYDLAEFRGLSGMGLEPKVDSSGTKDSAPAAGIVARSRLKELHGKVGSEYFAIMVLVCGIGFTFSDLHAQGLGDKRTLSDKLRVALNKAAAYYGMLKEEPMSDFIMKAHRLINDIKNRI